MVETLRKILRVQSYSVSVEIDYITVLGLLKFHFWKYKHKMSLNKY